MALQPGLLSNVYPWRTLRPALTTPENPRHIRLV